VCLKKILCLPDPPFDVFIDYGMIYYFLKLFTHAYYEFQYEALYCIMKICTGGYNKIISLINKGGISSIIDLTDSIVDEIQDLVSKLKLKN